MNITIIESVYACPVLVFLFIEMVNHVIFLDRDSIKIRKVNQSNTFNLLEKGYEYCFLVKSI